jgi:hypothetical protein
MGTRGCKSLVIHILPISPTLIEVTKSLREVAGAFWFNARRLCDSRGAAHLQNNDEYKRRNRYPCETIHFNPEMEFTKEQFC